MRVSREEFMVRANAIEHTELYTYTCNDGKEIVVHTDPAGRWHAGVSATVWDTSLVLSKHFEKICEQRQKGDTNNRLSGILQEPSLRIVELGAGCSALPSLILAHSLETLKTLQIHVTDKKDALPLLELSLRSAEHSDSIAIDELDWTNMGKTNLQSQNWFLIIMSDVLAFPELYASLIDTVHFLSTKGTLVYLAYERRNFAAEVEFFRLWGEAFKFEMVPESELDEQWRAPGEIYLYRGWMK